MLRLLALACALRLGLASAWEDEAALVQREVLALSAEEEDVFDVEEEDAPHGGEGSEAFRMGERVLVEGMDPLQYTVISGQGASADYYHLNVQGDTYLNVHKSKLRRWSKPTPLPAVFPTAKLDEPLKAKPLKAKPHKAAPKQPLAAKPRPRAAPKKPLAAKPPARAAKPAAAPKKPVPDTAAEAEKGIAAIHASLERKRAERNKVLKDQRELDEQIRERRKKLESELEESQQLARDVEKRRAEEAEKKAQEKAAKEEAAKEEAEMAAEEEAAEEAAAKEAAAKKKAAKTQAEDMAKKSSTAVRAVKTLSKIWR